MMSTPSPASIWALHCEFQSRAEGQSIPTMPALTSGRWDSLQFQQNQTKKNNVKAYQCLKQIQHKHCLVWATGRQSSSWGQPRLLPLWLRVCPERATSTVGWCGFYQPLLVPGGRLQQRNCTLPFQCIQTEHSEPVKNEQHKSGKRFTVFAEVKNKYIFLKCIFISISGCDCGSDSKCRPDVVSCPWLPGVAGWGWDSGGPSPGFQPWERTVCILP